VHGAERGVVELAAGHRCRARTRHRSARRLRVEGDAPVLLDVARAGDDLDAADGQHRAAEQDVALTPFRLALDAGVERFAGARAAIARACAQLEREARAEVFALYGLGRLIIAFATRNQGQRAHHEAGATQHHQRHRHEKPLSGRRYYARIPKRPALDRYFCAQTWRMVCIVRARAFCHSSRRETLNARQVRW